MECLRKGALANKKGFGSRNRRSEKERTIRNVARTLAGRAWPPLPV